MGYIGSTLLLFAGLGLGVVVLALALLAYGKGKKTADLLTGAVAFLFLIRAVQGLVQQSSGIACAMISPRGLALHGLSAAVLAGLAFLYLRELAFRDKED